MTTRRDSSDECTHRPAQVCKHRPGDYSQWAAERMVHKPGSVLTPAQVRIDFLGWCSGSFLKPEPMTKQRALIKSIGGSVKGFRDATRYLDVALVGPFPDSGYRVPVPRVAHVADTDDRHVVLEGLRTLAAAGLVTDPVALDQAYLHLTGAEVYLCQGCGRLTRHADRLHRGCTTRLGGAQ